MGSHFPIDARSEYAYLGLQISYFLIELIPFEPISLSSSTLLCFTTPGHGVVRPEAFNLSLKLDYLLLLLYEFHNEPVYVASPTLAASFLRSRANI
jgi:hypothetical protein